MISYLIDAVLVSALVFTSWRTGAMLRALRRLRSEDSRFGKALQDSDAALSRAAHAVVMLKHDGVATIRALDERIAEARRLAEWLDAAADDAAFRLAPAEAGGFVPPPPAPTQDNWLSLIESRLASASAANR